MKIESMLRKNKSTVAMATLALVILLPIGYYAARDAFSRSTEPFLEKPAPKYKECVRDTLYMRYHHMDLLKEIRDQVVREGKTSKITLENCRECHANRGMFCNQCHNAVNLHPDCFGCHNYPESPQEPLRAHASVSTNSAVADLLKPGH
jgi:hypothetical protein